jgi:pyrroloquinoline quinone (PQQ) biosynthesis protein C
MLYEPPLGPEDLKEPPREGQAFLAFLESQRRLQQPEPPRFYQDFYAGKLRRRDLQLWVKDLYSYWNHALVYSTGAILIKTNDERTRTNLLGKLVDLEGKDVVHDLTGWTTPAYEELWLRFGEGLGLTRAEVADWKPFTRSYYAQSTLCTLSRWWEWSWLDGIASLLAGDLWGQEYMRRAHEALQGPYAVPDESLEFFRVYREDVSTHIPWERDTLAYWACTTERQLTAAKAFRTRLRIEQQLLVRLHTAVTTETTPLQIP